MFEDYKYYLREEYDFAASTRIAIGFAVWVLGGVLGFIYEIIFYYANSGFKTFYWRGGTFGPWVEVYSIAALFIYLLLYRIRRQPWFIMLISAIGCSFFQLGIGLILYYLFNGVRAWNYNLEILNYGNLGGFICLRSVIEFAVFGLLVMYVIVPMLYTMAYRVKKGTFAGVWILIGMICLLDMLYNDVACSILPALPSATGIYQGLGLHYMKF